MGLTLRRKVNGAIIVTFLFIAAFYVAIQVPFNNHRKSTAIKSIEILLQTLVERDTEQLANEIFDARLKAIKIRIGQMKKVDGILTIAIFDKNGKHLASDMVDAEEQDLQPDEISWLQEKSLISEIEWKGQSVLMYSKKIAFLGEQLGFIRIYYSLQKVVNDIRLTFLIDASLLVTILLVMLVVLNWILSRAIIHPIMYLRDAAQYIAGGNYEIAVDMDRSDELGSLAESFEVMRTAIKDKIHDLEQLTKIIESTSDMVSWSSTEGRISYINKAGRNMLHISEDEPAESYKIPDLHPDEVLEKISSIGIPSAVEHGTWEGETAVLGKDDEIIPVSQVIISHKTPTGNLESLSTIIRDISDQKRIENELEYLRKYLTNIIDSMPSILIGVDRDLKVTQWNAEAHRKTGLSPESALGKNLIDAFPRMVEKKELLQKALSNHRMLSDTKHAYTEDGQSRFEDVTIYPLSGEGLEGAVIRIDDVTDRVAMEELMIQSEKMLSVGGLAAGMAHEINNPLAGMIQSASVIDGRLTDVEMRANQKAAEIQGISMQDIKAYMEARDIPRLLGGLKESGQRAAKITTNMLSFARKSDEGFAKQNLVELLDQTVEMAGSDYDLKKKFDFRRIEIIREYESDLPMVSCESGKIQQVLLNILRNGAEAMQEEESSSADMPDDQGQFRFIFRISRDAQPEMIKLEIEDNGPGMPEETRKRVFEPFFTTKPPGSGTGLGLSVSYFIITENHNGRMSVESQQGEGAKFTIQLPVNH